MRTSLCVFLVVLATGVTLFAAAGDLKDLQGQLAAVEQQEPLDNATVAELSRRILEIKPDDQEAWEKRVHALLELDQLKQAREALDAWERIVKPSSPAAINLEGDLALARKAYDKALDCWTSSLSGLPRRQATYENIAKVYEIQKRWDKVDETLSNLISWRQAKHLVTRMAVFEDTAETHVWRARIRLELHRWDDAIADINKANKLDPTDDTVKQWLPKFEALEKILPQIKDLEHKIATATAPQSGPLLDLGLLFNGLQFYNLALGEADTALTTTPKSKRAVLQKAQALIALSGTDDAAKLHVIIKNNKSTDAALRKIGAIDDELAAKPDEATLLTTRARECSDIEQFALAQEDAERAVKLNPESAEALVELGFAEMKLDDTHGARENFIRATKLDPKNAIAWRSLGELAMDRADYPAAIEDFSLSLALHESPLVLQKRELCYRYSGHGKEADEDLQRWQKLTPPKK